ncbi:MAG: hypothetical protein WDZ80_07460 [Candidatus Paceibacterota bacterium]
MDLVSDTLNVYLLDSETSSIGLNYILGVIKEIATIIAIVVGLILGHKGIKKYLLEDLIKSRVNRIHDANEKVFEVSSEIISEISDRTDLNRILKEEDIDVIDGLTKRLYKSAQGSSFQVETLAYLLHETTKNISPTIEKENYRENKTVADFFNLIHSTCVTINEYAGTIVELPNSIKTLDYSSIKKSVRKYLYDTEYKVFKDIKTGVTLNPNSAIINIYHDLIRNSSNTYVFSKRLFQTLQNNNPVLIKLFLSEIYFPLILVRKKESVMMGKLRLHLVDFRKDKQIIKDGKEADGSFVYKFYYSNINPVMRFVDNIKDIDVVKNDYEDSFLEDNYDCFKSSIEKFEMRGEETIVLTCSEESVKKYYTHQKEKIKAKLDSIKKNN